MEEFYRNMRKKFSILMEGINLLEVNGILIQTIENDGTEVPNTTEDFRPSHNHEKLFLEINNENIEHFGEGQETIFVGQ